MVGNLRGADEQTRDRDVFPVRDGFLTLSPVGSFPANGWGFFDLIGNVREWCADTFDPVAYHGRGEGARDPKNVGAGPSVVVRGGGYRDGPRTAGVATRLEVARDAHLPWMGLRVVRDVW
jgi:formylglycine-generating enzyme required for sulfatase activity